MAKLRPATAPTSFDRFWGAVGHLGNLQFVLSAAVACIATARKLVGVRAEWGPYVAALAGAWFFGTLFVVIVATHIVRWAMRQLKKPGVIVLAYGGESGAIRITRIGDPAEIVVEASVTKWTGLNPLEERPFTVTWEYEGDQRVFPREHQLASAHLPDGRSATIVLVKRDPPNVVLQAREPGANSWRNVLPDSPQVWPSVSFWLQVTSGSQNLYRGTATFRLNNASPYRVVATLENES